MSTERLTSKNERMRTNQYWLELDKRYRIQMGPTKLIVQEKGSGVEIWDIEGNRYMDIGWSASALTGHTHPAVLEAIRQQIDMSMQTAIGCLNIPRILLAKKLAAITPDPLHQSYFYSTGSESN